MRTAAAGRIHTERIENIVGVGRPDVDTLCQYFVKAAGVALVPGDAFGAPTCVRLSYAAGLDTLGMALDRLEAALGEGVYTPASKE